MAFQRQREAIAANKNYQAIKTHVVAHREAYIVGSIGAAGITGIWLFKQQPVNVSVAPVINNKPIFKPVFNNSNQQVNFGGRLTKVVKCKETGEMWEKVTEAAESVGVNRTQLSRHLNGRIPHVFDKHYEIVGIGTTG